MEIMPTTRPVTRITTPAAIQPAPVTFIVLYTLSILQLPPAYKGIPLSVATTMAISDLYGKDIRYCSNRKEVKDHGDTGILLGSKIKDGDRVMIIEDVTTSGKSIEETFPIIKAQGDVEIKGLIVSLNRMERGKGTKSGAICPWTEPTAM
jgi:orotate phosphoribosyltransferase